MAVVDFTFELFPDEKGSLPQIPASHCDTLPGVIATSDLIKNTVLVSLGLKAVLFVTIQI